MSHRSDPAPAGQAETEDGAAIGEEVEFDQVDTRLTVGRIILGLIVVASFAVWIYAYSGFADRVAPDTFDDPSFAERAEPICAAAVLDIEALPNALDAVDGAERAEQIRAVNARLLLMLDDLEAEVTGTERDRGIADLWLNRWRVIISDRAEYADRLEVDPNAVFYVSAEAGRRAERSLSYVADVNDMPSCGAPEDVG